MTLVWVIGTPISQTLSVSMLSKHFSQQQKAGVAPTKGVGFWMGLVTASGSVGRIIFPLVAGSLYEPYGSSSAFLFTSLVSFVTVPLIFFALKAYTPYLPWLKERFHCLLPADDEEEQDMQPHGMIRTGSNGDRTELLMLSSRHAPTPSQLTAEAGTELATGERQEVERAVSAASTAAPPAIYFVSSQPSPHLMGAAQPSTPLMRRGSLRNVGYYGLDRTSTADERGSLNS
jgi:MFS family permease